MTKLWLQIGLVALGAGASSALLFASMLSGSFAAVALFYLAPLPILIAAMGWSHWAGLTAALIAATGLLTLGLYPAIAFLISAGLPAWWLGYLALLARPAGPAGELEWYPVGRLVLWAAALAALMVLIALGQFGSELTGIHDTLHRAFERMLRARMRIPAGEALTIPGVSDPDWLIETMVAVLPPAATVVAAVTQIFNLWLAARIVRTSGRLTRPWPDLAAMRFPPATAIALAAAVGASFLPGVVGFAAALPAASLLLAYAVLGFAVMHGLTRHLPSRPIVLGGVYAAVAILGWPVLLMTLLGLLDSAFDLRARVSAMRGPPAPLA
jgi:hypothetical protein